MHSREARLRAFIETFDAFGGRIPAGLESWMGEILDGHEYWDNLTREAWAAMDWPAGEGIAEHPHC